MSLYASGSQTVGPYLHIGLTWLSRQRMVGPNVKGERVVIQGRVLDGDGVGVNDATIEVWQADAAGKYAQAQDRQAARRGKSFRGFGRVMTDAKGAFRISTIKPGRVPGPGGKLQAPHLSIQVFMRGLLKQLYTRIYFPDGSSNAQDPVLRLVPAVRRGTLLARPRAKGVLEWDVILQGRNETVFFDF